MNAIPLFAVADHSAVLRLQIRTLDGSMSLINVAIEQAHRAVGELL